MTRNHKLQKTMRSGTLASEPQKLFILVMGLAGAGKSTFISVLTENDDIPIGDAAQMHGGIKFS